MCDILLQSAQAYQTLMDYEYKIIGGRKGQTVEVSIAFPQDAYHHLVGFQYSRLSKLKGQKTALRYILDGQVSFEELKGSGFKHWDRVENLVALKECLENNRFVFRYKKHECPYSQIRADYLFSWDDVVFFTSNGIPVSLFRNQSRTDYARSCPQYTVLRIDRTNKQTGEICTVYQRQSKAEG